MLRRQNPDIQQRTRRNMLHCSLLLSRIHHQRLSDVRNKHMRMIGKKCLDLSIYLFILLICQCHNRVYNVWNGPFSMNIDQFRDHLQLNYYQSSFSFHRFLIHTEYIQIELGKNAIDQSTENSMRVFYGHHTYGELLYIFHQVPEVTIDTSSMRLYIKFAAEQQSYSRQRYSYDFQLFNIHTLRCIVEQLSISSSEFMHWPEKSFYIKKIEQIYSQDPEEFNRRVIKTCGILIGYLYRPTTEYVFPGYSFIYHQFSKHVIAFDASCSYNPYISYVLFGLFIYLTFKIIASVIGEINHIILSSVRRVHHSIEKQMRESNIDSLKNLDNLLSTTPDENNYYDRLFLVRDEHLIILMINLQETNQEILRQYYDSIPLFIIPIDNIMAVRRDCIVLENSYDYRPYIDFPTSNLINPSAWLHQRLMIISDQYRYNWEEEQRLRYYEATRQAQEREYQQRLAILTEEEAHRQRFQHGNDFYQLWERNISASPRFIAEFRLCGQKIVTADLLDKTCSICLDYFQLNQSFAQWPCTAKHSFHFDCMLNVLRTMNTCPLCRFPVEAANLSGRETILQLLFRNIMPNFRT